MPEYTLLYLMPVIGAAIGWITNFIAVKMLFHPREPRFGIQGVFPKRQQALAEKLGKIVSTELFSVEEVTKVLSEKARSPELMEKISAHIEKVITEKLPEAIPMLAMVMNPELVALVKDAFSKELEVAIEELISTLGSELEQELDVHSIVEAKVAAFSSDKLEEILFSIMRKEFKFIELVGAALGFMIGILQVLIILFEIS